MPRPTDLDSELVPFCDREMDKYRRDPLRDTGTLPYIPIKLLDDPVFREIWYAGCWLGRQLEALKCPLETRRRLCRDHGFKSLGKDTWSVAQSVLDEFRAASVKG